MCGDRAVLISVVDSQILGDRLTNDAPEHHSTRNTESARGISTAMDTAKDLTRGIQPGNGPAILIQDSRITVYIQTGASHSHHGRPNLDCIERLDADRMMTDPLQEHSVGAIIKVGVVLLDGGEPAR